MVSFSPGLTHSPDPYFRNVLLLPLIFSPFSLAAPIRDSSTPSNWLACLTTLLIFSVICLSVCKILFVRYRKVTNLRGPPSPPVREQYTHRSLESFARATCRSNKICKAGFLIGLFGSPSFEIRSKPSELTLIYPGVGTSGSSQKHDVSGDTTTTYKTKSSTFSTSPVVLFSDRIPWHIRQKSSHFSASFTKSTISRFLPSQLSFDLGRVGRKKRHVEVLTTREAPPWPHSHLEHTTLRLVKLYTEPEASLPFCKDPDAISGLPPLAPAAHGFVVAHLNRSYPSPISPLPFLPTRDTDDEDQIPRAPLSGTMIDHPYNNTLLTLVKPGRQSCRRASLSPNLSVIEETCHTSVPDHRSEQADSALPTHETMKSPPTIFSAYDTLRRKEKSRSSSLRNRRSPPLGPSPLRSMILPDVAEDDYSYTTIDGIKNCPVLKQRSTQCHHIGLGLPSIKLSPPRKGRIQSQDPGENDSEGSRGSRESMLDFLRELAEETREWDESIVLDEGFRNMIQHSQAILGCTSLENVNVKCSTPKIPLGSGGRDKTPSKFVSFWLEDSPSP